MVLVYGISGVACINSIFSVASATDNPIRKVHPADHKVHLQNDLCFTGHCQTVRFL